MARGYTTILTHTYSVVQQECETKLIDYSLQDAGCRGVFKVNYILAILFIFVQFCTRKIHDDRLVSLVAV